MGQESGDQESELSFLMGRHDEEEAVEDISHREEVIVILETLETIAKNHQGTKFRDVCIVSCFYRLEIKVCQQKPYKQPFILSNS